MIRKIFVNLPVKDLNRTKAFFEALGFQFNPQFSNEDGASMVINEHIYAMLLTESHFKTFTPKAICETATSTEVLIALSMDSREEVDALTAKAVAAGGTAPAEPRDLGFMYQHGFDDLDGHTWELFWMDPAAIEPSE